MLQRSVVSGKVSDADRSYLACSSRSDRALLPPEAQKRVDETLAEANRVTRETANTVRRGAIRWNRPTVPTQHSRGGMCSQSGTEVATVHASNRINSESDIDGCGGQI
jgi:hypothetical protein